MQDRKPRLSEAALSAHIDTLLSDGPLGPAAARLKQDWRSYVIREFRLTPAQQRHLANISVEQANIIQQAAIQALEAETGTHLSLQLPDNNAAQGGTIQITTRVMGTPASSTGGQMALQMQTGSHPDLSGNDQSGTKTAPILTCHFNADCSGWQCTGG